MFESKNLNLIFLNKKGRQEFTVGLLYQCILVTHISIIVSKLVSNSCIFSSIELKNVILNFRVDDTRLDTLSQFPIQCLGLFDNMLWSPYSRIQMPVINYYYCYYLLLITEFAITYPYFNSWYMNIVKTFYVNPSSNKNEFFFLTLISFNTHKSSSVTFQTKFDWHKIISSPDDY